MTKIYKIVNSQDGKIYVGQTTKTLEERLSTHFSSSLEGNRQKKIYNAILNYGRNNFSIELIEECPDEVADIVESYWIYKLNTIEDGYNSCFSVGKKICKTKELTNEEYLKRMEKTNSSNKKKIKTLSIDQFTLDGEYIRTFPSARAAEIFLFGDEHKAGRVSFLQQAARGYKPKAYGYKWAYHKEDETNK